MPPLRIEFEKGMPTNLPGGVMVDWHDRAICKLEDFSSDRYFLNCLIAWSFDELCGVRIFFPVTLEMVQLTTSKLLKDWETAKTLICRFTDEYSGDVIAILEMDEKIVHVQTLNWPISPRLESGICDVSVVMGNKDFSKWKELIYKS
jgi:hypothetical protein